MRTVILLAYGLTATAALAQPVVPPWGGINATPPGVVTYIGPAADAPGTPRMIVVDPQGDVCAVTSNEFSAIEAGALLVGVPAVILGMPTATTIPFTITPGVGGTATSYQSGYRVTGTGAPFTLATGSTSTTGSITGLTALTPYDVEVVAGNVACSQTSAAVTVSTIAALLPTTISSTVLAPDGLTLTMIFSQAVTLIAADVSFSVAGTVTAATDSDAATSSATHVFILATAATSGQAVSYTTIVPAFTTPPLNATTDNAVVTNNSTVGAGAQPPASSGIGPALAMLNAVYDTTTPQAGTGALSGGSGSATVTLAAGSARSLELWFKGGAPAVNTYGTLISDPNDNETVYVDPSGNIDIGTSGGNTYSNHIVTDNTWHHIALSIYSGTHTLFVDGISVGSSTAGQVAAAANPTLTIGNVSNFELDEVAVLSIPRTSNFTPPATPNTSTTAGIVAGWHLDGNGSSL